MNVMGIRAFLRGGYSRLKETTIISHRGRPLFTVIPFGGGDELPKATHEPVHPGLGVQVQEEGRQQRGQVGRTDEGE